MEARNSDVDSESFRKAAETIRVFNLKQSGINYIRRDTIKKYSYLKEDFCEFLKDDYEDNDLELVIELISDELSAISAEPNFTAIKHSLVPKELHRDFAE